MIIWAERYVYARVELYVNIFGKITILDNYILAKNELVYISDLTQRTLYSKYCPLLQVSSLESIINSSHGNNEHTHTLQQ